MANARAKTEQVKAQGMTGTFKGGFSLAGSRTVRVTNPETVVARPSAMNIFGSDGGQAPEQPATTTPQQTNPTSPQPMQRGGPPMMGRGRARGGAPMGRAPPMRGGPVGQKPTQQAISPNVENELDYMMDAETNTPQEAPIEKENSTEQTTTENAETKQEKPAEEDFDSFDAELNSGGYEK